MKKGATIEKLRVEAIYGSWKISQDAYTRLQSADAAVKLFARAGYTARIYALALDLWIILYRKQGTGIRPRPRGKK